MEAYCLYFIFYLHHSCLYLGLQYTTVKGDPQGTLEYLSHLVHVPVKWDSQKGKSENGPLDERFYKVGKI